MVTRTFLLDVSEPRCNACYGAIFNKCFTACFLQEVKRLLDLNKSTTEELIENYFVERCEQQVDILMLFFRIVVDSAAREFPPI